MGISSWVHLRAGSSANSTSGDGPSSSNIGLYLSLAISQATSFSFTWMGLPRFHPGSGSTATSWKTMLGHGLDIPIGEPIGLNRPFLLLVVTLAGIFWSMTVVASKHTTILHEGLDHGTHHLLLLFIGQPEAGRKKLTQLHGSHRGRHMLS